MGPKMEKLSLGICCSLFMIQVEMMCMGAQNEGGRGLVPTEKLFGVSPAVPSTTTGGVSAYIAT